MKNIGVDFCTQAEYPPLQYEGSEHCKLLHSANPALVFRA
jgi:hypothetical protein